MYVSRRLCLHCAQLEREGFDFTFLYGLLVIFLFVEVFFSML